MLFTFLKSSYYSILVFCFYSFLLILPSGYSFFAALLAVLSIAVLIVCRPLVFPVSDRLFAFFLALYPLSMIPSLLVKGGLWRYFDYPVRALLFIPLIIGLRALAKPVQFHRSFLLGCNFGGILAAMFSMKRLLLDHVGGVVGLPVAASIAYGQIAAILGLISFVSLFQAALPVMRAFAWLGFLGSVFAVTASSSTGALLGFVVGLSALMIFFFKDSFNRIYLLRIFATALLAVVILMPLMLADFPQIISDIKNYVSGVDVHTSQGERLLLWSIAIKEILVSPIVGIGPGHFSDVMHQYCVNHACAGDFQGFNNVHNQFLDSSMNAGFFGFIGLVASYLGPLVFFWQRVLARPAIASSLDAARAGFAVILASMISSLSQALYGHNISVISYFLTITFLWYLADQKEIRPCNLVED